MRQMPAFIKRGLTSLEPTNAAARDELAKCKAGHIVTIEVRRPRHIKHHNKLFALLKILVDNTETFATVDIALVAVKAALGRGSWVDVGGSKQLFIAESIAFESMSQANFTEFYNDAVAVIIKHWLPANDDGRDLREAVEAFQHL